MNSYLFRLYRVSTSDEGTFGYLMFNGSYVRTLELPWRDNKPNLSCIPTGTYRVRVRHSPKFGKCCHVTGVPNRSYILFHSGNFGGDRLRGFRTHISGCILLGTTVGRIDRQRAVLGSRIARSKFETAMNWEPFDLEIIDRC